MNVQTIEMDPRIARIHYADYLKKVREHRKERVQHASELEREAKKARLPKSQQEKEDQELLSTYRELARGQRLVNVHKTLWAAGLDSRHRPKLSIARAGWKKCHVKFENWKMLFSKESWTPSNATSQRYYVPIRPGGPAEYHYPQRNQLQWSSLEAIVPTIPPHLRPAGDLDDFWVLWEAEWTEKAPVDPILLKQVPDSDKFFVFLAHWDLTPLEQQVLEGRL